MSNRETFPPSVSPFVGDLSAIPGATLEAGLPTEQANLTYSAVGEQWEPQVPPNASILLNGFISNSTLVGFLILSDDYDFLVDHVGLGILVNWSLGFGFNVYVNGTGVA